MKYSWLIIILPITIFFASCKTNFTADLKTRLDADSVQVSNVQFYNSDKIILYRVLEAGEADVEEGKIKLRNGKHILLIKIKKWTPGIAVKDFGKSIKVAFGDEDSASIAFTPNEDEEPTYQISAESWDENNQGQITYNNTIYFILAGAHAKLLVRKKQELGAIIEREVAKGRRVE